VEKVLGKGIIGHVLRYQQSFITFITATNQIYQSPVPQLPHPCRFHLTSQGISIAIILDYELARNHKQHFGYVKKNKRL
jgi:hypothetical protein